MTTSNTESITLDTASNARPDDSLFCYTYNHFIQTFVEESYPVTHKLACMLVFLNGMLQETTSYTEDEYSFYFDTKILQDTFIGRNHFSVLNTLILSVEEQVPFTRESVDIQRQRIVELKEPVEDYHLVYNNGILLSNSDYKISGNYIEFPFRLTGAIEVIRFTKDVLGVNYPKLARESVFTQDNAELDFVRTTEPQGLELFSNGFLLPKYILEDLPNDNKEDFSYEIEPELIRLYHPLTIATQLDFVQFTKECDANNLNQDQEQEENTDYVGIDVDPEILVPDYGPNDWRPRSRDELEEDPDLNKRKFIVRLKDTNDKILANSQIVSIRTMDRFVALDKILTTPITSGNIVTINNRNFFNRTINTFTRSLSSLAGTQEVCPEDPVLLRITGSNKGIVFGGGKNTPYSADSDYNTAAVHSGLVKVGQKTILKRIEIRYYKLESRSDRAFIGSAQNGVKTFDRIEGCGFYLVDSRETETCQNPADTVDDYASYYTDAYTKTTLGKFFKGNYVKELNFNKTNTGIINSWYQDYLGRSPDQEGFAFFNKASETTHINDLTGLKQVFLQRANVEIQNQGKTLATFTYCQFQCLAFCDTPRTVKDANATYSTENIIIPYKGNIRRNFVLVKQPLTAVAKTINDWFLESLGRNADRSNFNKFITASAATDLTTLKTAFDNAIKSELETYGRTIAVYTTCEYKCTQLTIPTNNLSALLRFFNGTTKVEYPGESVTVNEGQRILFKLETTGISPNKAIPYTITGINAQDLSEGSLTGEFRQTGTNGINFNYRGNKQFYTEVFITIKEDYITEGQETLVLTLGTPFNSIKKTVVISDSSAPDIAFFVTNNTTGKILAGDPIEVNEGDVLRFSLRTTGVPLAGKIGYSLSSRAVDFADRRLQSFDLVSTHAPVTTVGTDLVYDGEFSQNLVFGDYFLSDIVTYQAALDQITDGAKYFNFRVKSSSYFTNPNLAANIKIIDSSRAFGLCATVYRDVYPPDLVANIKLLDGLSPQTSYTEYSNPIYPPFGINTAVEFTGYFTSPQSGPVTFTAETDDFVRIWIGNVFSSDPAFTITNALISTTSSQSATVNLNRDRPYPIRIQYANSQGLSYLKLSYQVPSQPVATNMANIVSKFNSFDLAPYNTCVTALAPGLCKYIYFNKTVASLSTLDTGYPDKSEKDLANPLSIPSSTDPFIVMWNGILRLPVGATAGNYTFGTTGVDDIIGVWIGDRAINLGTADVSKRLNVTDAVFQTTALNTPQEFTIYLEPNRNYPFRLVYVNITGPATFHFGIKTGGSFSTNLSTYLYNYGTCLICGLQGGDVSFSEYGPSKLPSFAADSSPGRIHNNNFIQYMVNGQGNGVLGKGNQKPGIKWDPTGTGAFPNIGLHDDYLAPGNPWETGLFEIKQGGNTFYIGGTNSSPPIPTPNANTATQWNIGVNRTFIAYPDTAYGKVTMEYNSQPGEAIIRIKMKYKNTSASPVTVKALRGTDPDADGWVTTNIRGADGIPATDLAASIGQSGSPMSIYTPGNDYTHNSAWFANWPNFDPDVYLSGMNDGDGDYGMGVGWNIGTVAPGQEVFVTCYYIISGKLSTTEKLIWGCISPPQNLGIPGLCRTIRAPDENGLIIVKDNFAGVYNPVKLPRDQNGVPYVGNFSTPEGNYVTIDVGNFMPATTETYTFTSSGLVGSLYLWFDSADAAASAAINLTTADIKNVNGTGTLTFNKALTQDTKYAIKLMYISPIAGVPAGTASADLKYSTPTKTATNNFGERLFHDSCPGTLSTFTLTTSSAEVNEDAAYSFSVVTNTEVPVGTVLYWEFDNINIKDINPDIGTFQNTTVASGQDPIFGLKPVDIGNLVNSLYIKHLGRFPENAGAVDGRVNDIIAGTYTLDQTSGIISNSVEATSYRPGGSQSRRKGNFTVTSGRNDSVNFTVVRDYTTEGPEVGNLLIRTVSNQGPIVTSADIKIVDTSMIYGYIGNVHSSVSVSETYTYTFVGLFTNTGDTITLGILPADPAPSAPVTDLSSADITFVPSSFTVTSSNVTAFTFDATISGTHTNNKAFRITANIGTSLLTSTGTITLETAPAGPMVASIIGNSTNCSGEFLPWAGSIAGVVYPANDDIKFSAYIENPVPGEHEYEWRIENLASGLYVGDSLSNYITGALTGRVTTSTYTNSSYPTLSRKVSWTIPTKYTTPAITSWPGDENLNGLPNWELNLYHVVGGVVASTPCATQKMICHPRNGAQTWAIALSTTTANEGDTVTVTVNTTGVIDGTKVFMLTGGTTKQGDFVIPGSFTFVNPAQNDPDFHWFRTVTISSGTGTFDLEYNTNEPSESTETTIILLSYYNIYVGDVWTAPPPQVPSTWWCPITTTGQNTITVTNVP